MIVKLKWIHKEKWSNIKQINNLFLQVLILYFLWCISPFHLLLTLLGYSVFEKEQCSLSNLFKFGPIIQLKKLSGKVWLWFLFSVHKLDQIRPPICLAHKTNTFLKLNNMIYCQIMSNNGQFRIFLVILEPFNINK